MTTTRAGRTIGIIIGTLAILAVGVYGPATLLGPLPAVSATPITPPASQTQLSPPVMPAEGASAVTLTAGGTDAAPLAVAGVPDAVPIASIAKIVTALVVLDAKPVEPGRTGPAITITNDDYQSYIGYSADDARAVIVFAGEVWTEREMLQAMLLGSSNNHADSLARWAYGSVDGFLEAANAWLTKNGLTTIHLADATGLSEQSVGTASDLARLAALAMGDPTIAEILANPTSALVNNRGVENTTAYLDDQGITGISRSYTDAAGVCFLFAATVPTQTASLTFYGAFVREPDYDTLTSDLEALMASATAGISDVAVVEEGTPYVTFTALWGDTASGVASLSKVEPSWTTKELTASVTTEEFSTGVTGRKVGRVSFETGDGEFSVPLELDRAIRDPGPGWRLLNPIPVIGALIDSQQ
ncbi:D-alanyl-D-alanine carboxypeptidase family protein [Compostimonas suwonensis]|uniref:D-alanyl-D-alanine carboxypeptidase (Penicillin-binding protein 5/6) n=1 Tax=Compostimonas suwonensis TaxID=1048394 RepID=A0A2M9BZQ6_9MICO|nr:D-alanyl-D-alanine carboxypeptidase [Compostimonas suwonensis]PJJ63530.1 D-alanyl-D-alanine carboxypeptidase (penicillin-binding protein 5/6) [Compostimonas suwonensis]